MRCSNILNYNINCRLVNWTFKVDQILVVAPPKILGDLRREFAKTTKAKIIAEIANDLTFHTDPEIERLLTPER